MALNPRMIDWRGRRVWLVGASTGFGRALAASLHAQGAQVIVSARQAQGRWTVWCTAPATTAA